MPVKDKEKGLKNKKKQPDFKKVKSKGGINAERDGCLAESLVTKLHF